MTFNIFHDSNKARIDKKRGRQDYLRLLLFFVVVVLRVTDANVFGFSSVSNKLRAKVCTSSLQGRRPRLKRVRVFSWPFAPRAAHTKKASSPYASYLPAINRPLSVDCLGRVNSKLRLYQRATGLGTGTR